MGKTMNQAILKLSLGVWIATFSAGLVACQQDPFAEKSEAIRQGVPPELDREPPAPKPMASDAVRIDTNDFYNFKEQVEGEITIAGRVLQDTTASFELSIDNLADFPGASFDSKTGVFKWSPARGSTGGDYAAPKRLVARLTAKQLSPGGTVETTIGTTKAILVYVARAETDPEIVEVKDLVTTFPVREGELRKFTVMVKDPDALDTDGMRPRLMSIPAKRGATDVSGLVYQIEDTQPNPTFNATTGLWTFRMVLDLRLPANQRGRDFTNSKTNFQFGLQATTRFGRVAVKTNDFDMVTDISIPEISWADEPIEVIAGIENAIQFTVYDPLLEGKLSVDFPVRVDQLPGSAAGSCREASREGNILCQISWKPSAVTAVQDVPFKIHAVNSARTPGDRWQKETTFNRKFRIKPGATPTPSPSPAPVQPAPTKP